MTHPTRLRFAFVSALLLLLPMAALAQQVDPAPVYTVDDEYLAMANEVPGFGGLFYDDEGIANVWVTDAAKRNDISRLAPGEINFLPADYAWDELMTIRQQVLGVMNQPGVVFLDIDETKNRVHIGISGVEGRKTARAASIAAQFGVPAKSLVITETAPFEQHVDLRDSRRPVPGGMQIGFTGFACTMGFPARRGNTNGFVTNSHCSAQQGGNQNTAYTQGSNATVARESVDPNYSGNLAGCPNGRVCRRSDSAFARWVNGTQGQLGRIARTTCRNCGNLTIGNNGNRRFRITEEGNANVNTTVHKVGRTTGWTSGRVTQSCVTTNVAQSNITLICQTLAGYNSDQGDSGSPVFVRRGGNRVRLVGINWGGNATTAVYSPLNEIEGELGNLTVR